MKDQVLCVDYFAIESEDKPGMGADLETKLTKEGVNLLALHAFLFAGGKTQVDIIPENPDAFTRAAKKLNLVIRGPKIAFLVHGTDKPGAMGEILDKLGKKGINVRSTCELTAGANRYGAILWVAPADVDAATRALGAEVASHHHI